MFTGIVECTGKVVSNSLGKLSLYLSIGPILKGDSVCVNGVCLTALNNISQSGTVVFDLSPETRDRSNLGKLKKGDLVNIELAMKATGRFGGHFLTGHIDSIVRLIASKKNGNSYEMSFELPKDSKQYIVEKGSVGIDGISLTVAKLDKNSFTVAVIEHTKNNTSLKTIKPQDEVNFEADVLARHLEKLAEHNLPKKTLTKEYLKDNGFL